MRSLLLALAITLVSITIFTSCSKHRYTKTIYLIGDSTVKNGKGDGARGLWGWGDFINQYFDTTKIHIQNHALGGTSSRTFRSKGLWKPVLDSLREGDFVLIQFGHNDAGNINDTLRARGTIKGIGDETEEIDNLLTGEHEIVHTYGWYLRQFVEEIKSKDAIPVIISPIPRNVWKNGKVVRNNEDYGLWAKQIAEEEEVSFINLNEKSALAMEFAGEENMLGNYFYERDHTHTTAKGAVLNASLIVEALKEIRHCKMHKYFLPNPKITIPSKHSVFIIGDSTVEENGKSNVGWGKILPEFLDTTRLNIYNHARGGRSSRTFRSEELWQEVVDQLQPGDFVLMQFGHNDGGEIDTGKRRGSLKGNGDQSEITILPNGEKEVVHTYGWYMRRYIKDAKEKGAFPIVFSQVPRNEWPKNKVERVNTNYGKWALEAAEIEGATFYDLNEVVALKYEDMGRDSVKTFFPFDHTHTNAAGARLNALTIAELVQEDKDCPLSDYIELKK